ncbi:hypothetical protein BGZ73_005698 [Actinomortierella ambigua]|nr:hypothetical protein BGZ73_005698 [Actinomortierella ambigua]
MAPTLSGHSSSSPWGYDSLDHHQDDGALDSYPLQSQRSRNDHRPIQRSNDDSDSEDDDMHALGYNQDDNKGRSQEYRLSLGGDQSHDKDRGDGDEDDEEDDEDFLFQDDLAPLDRSKRSKFNPATAPRHPCKVLATVFGTATVVALAFALLSLLHIGQNNTLNNTNSNSTAPVPTFEPGRLLYPPPGVRMDDFDVTKFELPAWGWDLTKFLPIDITNGPEFARISWKNGEQYLNVSCPEPYQYHFPSFAENEFKTHPVADTYETFLPMGEEPYVFVLCPPGINNANVVMREHDEPDPSMPAEPPRVAGSKEAPQPLMDDVVMILVDAISRGKFIDQMVKTMAVLDRVNNAGAVAGTGHRIFDFKHYNVHGRNSPPNKAVIYSGQRLDDLRQNTHWLWDTYQEQGFATAHTDGECGGQKGLGDYVSGAITSEYAHVLRRVPAQYQMPEQMFCENHDMHVVAHVWGQSCTLPPRVNYDKDLMGGMRWNTPYCAGNRALHEYIMEDLQGWLASKKGQRRFATYSFMDAHSPGHHSISFDARFADFMESLLLGKDGNEPLLSPRSTLVIMADHGLHYGPEYYSFSGFLHHHIPPLFMAVPRKTLADYPDFARNLEDNQERIVSHLDLHQTFNHLAYGDQGPDVTAEEMALFLHQPDFRQRFHPQAPAGHSFAQEKGMSLFLPIDIHRSCFAAGIPNDWCAFQPFLIFDPQKQIDAVFMQQSLTLVANKMNEIMARFGVQDICRNTSMTPWPLYPGEADPNKALNMKNETRLFEDVRTDDLVMQSGYASALPAEAAKDLPGQSRVFYLRVQDRRVPHRLYAVNLIENEVIVGNTTSMEIQQMSAYESYWAQCRPKLVAAGFDLRKNQGELEGYMKHLCVC